MKKIHNLNRLLGFTSVLLLLPIIAGFAVSMLYLVTLLAVQMGIVNTKQHFQMTEVTTLQLPETGNVTKKLSKTFTHPSFGYSFRYSESEILNDSPISEVFLSANKDQKEGSVYIENLKIKTFHSDKILDIDFDEGLLRSDYREPKRINVGNEEFFLIITKDGYVRYIVKEYKYLDDTLWVKLDKHINGTTSNYYISFFSTEEKSFPLTDISRIKGTLESFNF